SSSSSSCSVPGSHLLVPASPSRGPHQGSWGGSELSLESSPAPVQRSEGYRAGGGSTEGKGIQVVSLDEENGEDRTQGWQLGVGAEAHAGTEGMGKETMEVRKGDSEGSPVPTSARQQLSSPLLPGEAHVTGCGNENTGQGVNHSKGHVAEVQVPPQALESPPQTVHPAQGIVPAWGIAPAPVHGVTGKGCLGEGGQGVCRTCLLGKGSATKLATGAVVPPGTPADEVKAGTDPA
ncbi:unnamed protein product, partial [Discosporangium mesarthrocarpum]